MRFSTVSGQFLCFEECLEDLLEPSFLLPSPPAGWGRAGLKQVVFSFVSSDPQMEEGRLSNVDDFFQTLVNHHAR